ncbi:hypothetical protein [Pantoea agglomerans]|uniref:hypothetical protein n=1 Tax=Enterobacter agglomerans TaxID=549 RepID=UPI0016549271|nr:hypothetical protein [Pantoea agglomerans]
MRKACVIYIEETEHLLPATEQKLQDIGFSMCSVKLEKSWSEEKSTPAVEGCQRNAEVCIFLLDDKCNEYPSFGGSVGCAAAGGINIVGVTEIKVKLPAIIDEKANSVISIQSPKFQNAVEGESIWEDSDGNKLPRRKIDRVRCQ